MFSRLMRIIVPSSEQALWALTMVGPQSTVAGGSSHAAHATQRLIRAKTLQQKRRPRHSCRGRVEEDPTLWVGERADGWPSARKRSGLGVIGPFAMFRDVEAIFFDLFGGAKLADDLDEEENDG